MHARIFVYTQRNVYCTAFPALHTVCMETMQISRIYMNIYLYKHIYIYTYTTDVSSPSTILPMNWRLQIVPRDFEIRRCLTYSVSAAVSKDKQSPLGNS